MPSLPSSDVHVFVRYKDQCIFAGEELTCTITFKNVAEVQERPSIVVPTPRQAKRNSISQVAANQQAARAHAGQGQNVRPIGTGRGGDHGSGSVHQTSALVNTQPPVDNGSLSADGGSRPGQKHQRSVSIISMNSPTIDEDETDRNKPSTMAHRRSSTMQIHELSRRSSLADRLPSDARAQQRSRGSRSPLAHSHSPATEARESTPEFKFPSSSPNTAATSTPPVPPKRVSPDPHTQRPSHQRVPSNVTSTRDSMDIYSTGAGSNHSDETLMSEQVSMISERPAQRPRMPSEMIRQHYRMGPPPPPTPRRPHAVTLLMGYAQVGATFTLDASLVDQTPFEEVKKKGYLGGQAGGGVVGVNKKKARPSSGILGGFSFSSLGESLESIMTGAMAGSNEASSAVKEMKAVSNARAIPLLSTPQSLLFVDLRLEPGEQRSFSFKCKLPRGLPASYRGKAIKIAFNLTIGIQSAPGAGQKDVSVRQISVPFKVFPGVDPSDGEILGHDLLQPHVILKDLAMTKEIVEGADDEKILDSMDAGQSDQANNRFLDFVDSILDRNRRRQSSTGSMMEQMMLAQSSRMNGGGGGRYQSPAVQAINRAIMFSNQTNFASSSYGNSTHNNNSNTGNETNHNANSDSSSPNRFEITRAGQRVAVVSLDRPLHRLGETITVITDLSSSQVTCASLRMSLETSEKVDASLAVRSAATIARVTRKIYASKSENVLFARRAVFRPTIPVLVSPTFVTSGVALEWCVKLEFVTVRPKDVDNEEEEEQQQQQQEGEAGDRAEQQQQQQQISPSSAQRLSRDRRRPGRDGNDEVEEVEEENDDDDDGKNDTNAHERTPLAGDERPTTTPTRTQGQNISPAPHHQKQKSQLLEEILTDERGVTEVAVENLDCDHFEVAIPITVYGDIAMDGSTSEEGRDEEVVGIPI